MKEKQIKCDKCGHGIFNRELHEHATCEMWEELEGVCKGIREDKNIDYIESEYSYKCAKCCELLDI